MTIRRNIDANAAHQALKNLEACAENAPEWTYEDAKALNEFFADTFKAIAEGLAMTGLKLTMPNSDTYREVEALLYAAIKAENPDSTLFAVAEGFGAAMDTPARDRVIAQAKSEGEFLRGLMQDIAQGSL